MLDGKKISWYFPQASNRVSAPEITRYPPIRQLQGPQRHG
jgi:hypothetical protein